MTGGRLAVVGPSALGALLLETAGGDCWGVPPVGGWTSRASPAEAVTRADHAVIGEPEAALLARGVAHALPPGGTVVLAGTADARSLAPALEDAGAGVLEARVVEGPTVLVAGDRDVHDGFRPCLADLPKPLFVGPLGAAAAAMRVVGAEDADALERLFARAVENGAFAAQLRNAVRLAGRDEALAARAAELAKRYPRV